MKWIKKLFSNENINMSMKLISNCSNTDNKVYELSIKDELLHLSIIKTKNRDNSKCLSYHRFDLVLSGDNDLKYKISVSSEFESADSILDGLRGKNSYPDIIIKSALMIIEQKEKEKKEMYKAKEIAKIQKVNKAFSSIFDKMRE